MSRLATTLALLAALTLVATCGDNRRATATRISSIGQRIGGPKALGDVGDYLLENDKIRVIVHGPGPNRATTIFAGSLIDADLQRPGGSDSRGNDQLGEVLPAFVFEVMDPTSFTVTRDGSDGGAAIVTLEGVGGDFLQIVSLLNLGLINPPALSFQVDYKLEPGNSYVEIITTVRNVGNGPTEFPAIDPPELRNLGLDIPGLEDLQLSTPFGHYLILGAEQKSFATGRAGFDVRFTVERLFDEAVGLPAFPGLVSDFVATHGDGVSYGLTVPVSPNNYASVFRDSYQTQKVEDYSVLVPFLFSSATAVYHTNPPPSLQPGEEFSYSAYFIVGRGDVASVADTVYEIQGVQTGIFAGRVFDAQTQVPVAKASLVVKNEIGDYANQFLTDDRGQFRGELPAGNYTYQLVRNDRTSSEAASFSVAVGQTTSVVVPFAAPGRISVTVTDTDGRKLPCKVTLVGRFDPAQQGQDPREFLYDLAIGEPERTTTYDAQRNEFVEGSWYTGDGQLQTTVRPGNYDLVVSRGMEYDLHIESVAVTPGGFIDRRVSLQRSVNTSGYVLADLHLHAVNSVDSSMSLEDRVVSIAAEGVEYAAATDHNAVTDYAPAIGRMGLTEWIVSSVGTETTSVEMGHFNGYPLIFDSGSPRGGDVVWAGETPDSIFSQIRDLGKYGPENTIIQVNHPRWDFLGYFNAFNYDQEVGDVTSKAGLASVLAPFGPEFALENFSYDFDAVEIINGKRQDLVHTYRVPSVLPPPPLPQDIPPAGEILRDSYGKIAFPGVLDDWHAFLNQGRRFIGVGSSDSHRPSAQAGFPGTYVWLGEGKDISGGFSEMDVVNGLRSGRVIISMGAFAEMTVNGNPVGSELTDTDGTVDIQIRAQVPGWLELSRAIVYANGEIVLDIPIQGSESKNFITERTVAVDRDTWFMLEVVGPTNLFPVVTPREFPSTSPQTVIDALSVSFDLSALDPYGNLRPQEAQLVTPQAITNPIWVDVDGNGTFEAPGVGLVKARKPASLPDVRKTFNNIEEVR